jgi:outer membrane protein TolC
MKKTWQSILPCAVLLSVPGAYALVMPPSFPVLTKMPFTVVSAHTNLLKDPNVTKQRLANATVLTLQNAVLLALHKNPQLQISFNNRKLSTYDLVVARDKFFPQVSLASTASYTKNNYGGDNVDSSGNTSTRSYNVGPTMNWTLPLGTTVTGNYAYNPSIQGGASSTHTYSGTWSVSLTQPLLQNFGTSFNEIGLKNAYDAQKNDNYQLRQTLQTTISQVIDNYYAVVQAKENLRIANQSLVTSGRTLSNRKALLRAGRIPPTDITQSELDITAQEETLSGAKQTLKTARATLLETLGLSGNTLFHVVSQVDADAIHPAVSPSQQIALRNNLTMKMARIQYTQAQRNIITEDNSRKWKLDLTLTHSRQRMRTIYANANIDSNNESISTNNVVSLNLNIPLNRVTIDQSKLSAAISMQNSQISLRNSKREVLAQVQTAIQTLDSDWVQLQTSKKKLTLSEASFKAAEVKAQYGRIDAFTLSQQQQQLISSQQNLVNQKISYLKEVTSYEKLMGTLLSTWHVHVTTPSYNFDS